MPTPQEEKDFVYAANDAAKLRSLLEQNPEAAGWRDDAGNTGLIRAVFMNNRDSVELLLKAGSDVNAKNAPGMTALHLAVKFGHAELAGLLLGAGANPDLKDPLGRSARDDVGSRDAATAAAFRRIPELKQEWAAKRAQHERTDALARLRKGAQRNPNLKPWN
jgi:ankyrin repeat protein